MLLKSTERCIARERANMITVKTAKRAVQLTRGEVSDLEVLIRARIEYCEEAAECSHVERKEYRAEARRLRKLYVVVTGVES
jgi:hypothetical protein